MNRTFFGIFAVFKVVVRPDPNSQIRSKPKELREPIAMGRMFCDHTQNEKTPVPGSKFAGVAVQNEFLLCPSPIIKIQTALIDGNSIITFTAVPQRNSNKIRQ